MNKESKGLRSHIMRSVKGADTKPEMLVRRWLHAMGYRYRLHRRDLPCKPDIVFPSRRKIIFVHGCFWHGHDCKRGARIPVRNRDYWLAKIMGNRRRDFQCMKVLEEKGWKILVLWECELKDEKSVLDRLVNFLEEN